MTFAPLEESRDHGEPVELYLFKYGQGVDDYYAYTDAEQVIIKDGVSYQPIPIERGGIESSGTLDKQTISIQVPINSGVSELFRVYPPGQVVSIVIWQGHADDPDAQFLVIWSGRVISNSREGSDATLSCESSATSMKRTMLRKNYQLSCPYVLYGDSCRADKAAATISRAVIFLTGSSVTLTDGWSNPIDPKKYLGGMVEWTAEKRTILRVNNDKTLMLSGPTTGLTAGDMINVVLGCNHFWVLNEDKTLNEAETDCVGLHDNGPNYGGEPWIPTDNPINTNPFS